MKPITYLFVDETFGTIEEVQQFFSLKGADGYYWKGKVDAMQSGTTNGYKVIGVFCSYPMQ